MAKASKTTFIPAVNFTGYPEGKSVSFVAGVESPQVPAKWVKDAALEGKGLIQKPSSKEE